MSNQFAIAEKDGGLSLFNAVRFLTRAAARAELLRLVELGHEGLVVVKVFA